VAKLKVQKHKAVHHKFIDEALIRYADDLVSAIMYCDERWMRYPTPHMRRAMEIYSDYRKELIG